MVYCAMFAALIAVCSWIAIPATVPFTLQTFGVFCAVGALGGARGTAAVAVYIALGAVGAPVFSGFRGGISALVGPTGGYIAGFLLSALVYWGVTALLGEKLWVRALGMVLGLAACYAGGTAWMLIISDSVTTLGAALTLCVVPYLLPDAAKLALALALSGRLRSVARL